MKQLLLISMRHKNGGDLLMRIFGHFALLIGILPFFLLASNAIAASPDDRCVQLFRSKQYLKAGECFESLAQALGPSQGLAEAQKNFKGRLLRNAAIAFRKYANQLTPALAAKWRLRALKHLQTYQQEKLCETAERCRITQSLAQSIRREIGLTPLTITTGNPNSTIELNGDVFNDKGKSNQLKWKVPPGEYVVVVTYPGQSPQSKKITITSGKPGLLSFEKNPKARTPPPPPPKVRSGAPLIILITGIAVTAVGGALLLAGIGLNAGQQGAIDSLKARKNQANQVLKAEDTDMFLGQYETHKTLILVGWIALGVGAAVTIGGAIWGGVQGGMTATKASTHNTHIHKAQRLATQAPHKTWDNPPNSSGHQQVFTFFMQ